MQQLRISQNVNVERKKSQRHLKIFSVFPLFLRDIDPESQQSNWLRESKTMGSPLSLEAFMTAPEIDVLLGGKSDGTDPYRRVPISFLWPQSSVGNGASLFPD